MSWGSSGATMRELCASLCASYAPTMRGAICDLGGAFGLKPDGRYYARTMREDRFGGRLASHKRRAQDIEGGVSWARTGYIGVGLGWIGRAAWSWMDPGGAGCPHTVNIQSTSSQHTVNIPAFVDIPVGFRTLRAF